MLGSELLRSKSEYDAQLSLSIRVCEMAMQVIFF